MTSWQVLLQHDLFSLIAGLCVVEELEALWTVHQSFRWIITYYLKHTRSLSLSSFNTRPLVVHLLGQPVQINFLRIRQPILISPSNTWLETLIRNNSRTITHLYFQHRTKDHRILDQVSQCSNLEKLVLHRTIQPSEQILKIVKNCPHLQNLCLQIPGNEIDRRPAMAVARRILKASLALRHISLTGASTSLLFTLTRFQTLEKLKVVLYDDDDTLILLLFLRDFFPSWSHLQSIDITTHTSHLDALGFLRAQPTSYCVLPSTLISVSIPVFLPLQETKQLLSLVHVDVDYMAVSSLQQLITTIPSLKTVIINSMLVGDPLITSSKCAHVPSLTFLEIAELDSSPDLLIDLLFSCIHLQQLSLDMIWPSSKILQQVLLGCSKLRHLDLAGGCQVWNHISDSFLELPALVVLDLFALQVPFQLSAPTLCYCTFDGATTSCLDLSTLFTAGSTLREFVIEQPFILAPSSVQLTLTLTRLDLSIAMIDLSSLHVLLRATPSLTWLKIRTEWTDSLFPLFQFALITKCLSSVRFSNSGPLFELNLEDIAHFLNFNSLRCLELGNGFVMPRETEFRFQSACVGRNIPLRFRVF